VKSGNFPFPGKTEWEMEMLSLERDFSSLLALPKLRQYTKTMLYGYILVYKYYGKKVHTIFSLDRETGNFPILTALTVLNSHLRKVLIPLSGISMYEA
jgi:hypothetical protein